MIGRNNFINTQNKMLFHKLFSFFKSNNILTNSFNFDNF